MCSSDRARAGGFPGAEIILAQLQHGTTEGGGGREQEGRARVGGEARMNDTLAMAEKLETDTTGGFGAAVGAPVAMGYGAARQAAAGTVVAAEQRGRAVACTVSPLPFVPAGFRR